jgi:hypothetical protein
MILSEFKPYYFLLITFLFFVCPMMGQAQKKVLDSAGYASWGIMRHPALAESGNFFTYQMFYPNLSDTLFVRTLRGELVLIEPKGHSGAFLKESFFGYLE